MSNWKNTKARKPLSLAGAFLGFFLLFNVPFIGLPSTVVGGYPALMLYIGVCWILLIIIMAMTMMMTVFVDVIRLRIRIVVDLLDNP